MRHADKVAVVTGAARGIGQAFAIRLAAEGANVVMVDLGPLDETAAQIDAFGRKALVWRADVSDCDAVAGLAHAVESEFGRCDILVNNAGIFPSQPFLDISFADWRRVMSVNLDGVFLMCRAFAPGMMERRYGRIINMASNTFGQVSPGMAHYIASKGGVIGFTRALATDLGKHGVTVNAIAPGFTQTPGTAELGGNYRGMSIEDLHASIAAKQAIPRRQQPDDLAGAMSFLASDDAAFLTAQTLYVDGGLVRA